MQVIAVEGSDKNSEGALKRKQKLEVKQEKLINVTFVLMITITVSVEKFAKLVRGKK